MRMQKPPWEVSGPGFLGILRIVSQRGRKVHWLQAQIPDFFKKEDKNTKSLKQNIRVGNDIVNH